MKRRWKAILLCGGSVVLLTAAAYVSWRSGRPPDVLWVYSGEATPEASRMAYAQPELTSAVSGWHWFRRDLDGIQALHLHSDLTESTSARILDALGVEMDGWKCVRYVVDHGSDSPASAEWARVLQSPDSSPD